MAPHPAALRMGKISVMTKNGRAEAAESSIVARDCG